MRLPPPPSSRLMLTGHPASAPLPHLSCAHVCLPWVLLGWGGGGVRRGNIRVYCRVRPILENEHRRAGPGQDVDVTSFPVEGEIIVKQVRGGGREWGA